LNCYRCKSSSLVLATLTEEQGIAYPVLGLVLRRCQSCGLEQNHYKENERNDEPLDPFDAADHAPIMGKDGLVTEAARLWVKPTEEVLAERAQRKRDTQVVTEESPSPLVVVSNLGHRKTNG